jgi:heme/copper-type cytochrome/quinol oxidase subunit 2
MRGYVTIHTQEEYDAWLAEEGAKLSSEDSAWN